MSNDMKEIEEMVENVLKEYFALTGPSLPTAGGVPTQSVGPFAQYVNSTSMVLDRILDVVNGESVELDKRDVQEFLYNSVPRLLAKIDTVCSAMERKTGIKRLSKTKPAPLMPPAERRKKIKIK